MTDVKEKALAISKKFGGKLEVISKVPIETMEDRINAIKSLGRKISAINETEIIIETVQIQRRGCACSECD